MKSILYWHPNIYNFLVRLMYKTSFNERYTTINNLITDNSSVVDVCCGDSYLYSYLKNKNINYLGLDFNPTFINISKRKGIKARLFNIYEDPIPHADYIIIQTSLYQFIPNHDQILKKLYQAADKYLIITETMKSYGGSKNKFFSKIGKYLNNPGDGIKENRFSLITFKKAMEPFQEKIENEFFIKGNIDYVVVIKKKITVF